MPHKAAHHSGFLLPVPGQVLLDGGPGMSELDVSSSAPPYRRLVDEGAGVVRVDARYRKGGSTGLGLPDPRPPGTAPWPEVGTDSVQPVQTSVANRRWLKEPTREPPQWATMSISRNPSGGRSHPS